MEVGCLKGCWCFIQNILRVVSLKSCLLCKDKGRKRMIFSFLRAFFLRGENISIFNCSKFHLGIGLRVKVQDLPKRKNKGVGG